MLQDDVADYTVVKNEEVTVTVEGKFKLVDFVVDGEKAEQIDDSPPTFVFTVSKPSGESHFSKVVCDFPPGAAATDCYAVFLSGNKNPGKGVTHTGTTVCRDDFREPSIVFNVS